MGSQSAIYTSTIVHQSLQFEELHNLMKRNGSLVLGLFDELSSLYAQLNLFKHNCSVMNSKTIIALKQFMDKELLRLHIKNNLQHLWIHPTSVCGKGVTV